MVWQITPQWKPTGRKRFRISFFGKLIGQVEEVFDFGKEGVASKFRWRDATVRDLPERIPEPPSTAPLKPKK